MHADPELILDRVAPSPRTPLSRLAELSDGELLATTQRLAGTSNQIFAVLLEHLAEVDARGVHRTRACSSVTPRRPPSGRRPRLRLAGLQASRQLMGQHDVSAA